MIVAILQALYGIFVFFSFY